jgi:hypothetical protein
MYFNLILGCIYASQNIIFGGLMKKSLILGVPAALVLALLFAGCPTEAEEDSDGSGFKGSYQKDVDGIAVAFADGAPVVYLKDNLHLGNDELVVPANRTLDISNNVTIDQIGANGKIVVVGNITFTNDPKGKYDIELFKSPTAKLIATKAFIDGNVETLADDEAAPVESGKHVKALADQIIPIADFNVRDADAWKGYIDAQTGVNSKYIPVLYAGEIDDVIADNISYYGATRRVYIIGDITITAGIDLTGDAYPGPTPDPDGDGNLYNIIPDDDSSLLIGGAVVVKGNGTVTTTNGFTVLGTLATADKNITINAGGILIAYIARLDGTGATFKGPVHLIGSLPSNFGEGSFFYDELTVDGSVIVKSANFVGGDVIFNGPVEFTGDSNSISNSKADGTTVTIYLNSTVTFTNTDPIDLAKFDFSKNAKGTLTYDNVYTNGTTSTITFDLPVTFNNKATFSGSAGAVVFDGGVTFNKNVELNPYTTLSFGTGGATTFAKEITLNYVGGGSFGAAVTFNGDAEIKEAAIADFQGKVTARGKLTLNSGGIFNAGAQVSGDFTVPAGSMLVVGSAAAFSYGDGAIKIGIGADDVAWGTVSADDVPLVLKGGAFNIGAGSLTLGTASIDVSGGGRIVFESGTAAAAGTYGLILSGPTETTYIKTGNYTVAGVATKVNLLSAAEGGQVVLSKASIGNGGGSQGILNLGGSYGVEMVLLTVSSDTELDGVALDLQGGGSIAIDADADKPVVITLKGGTVDSGLYTGGEGSVALGPAANSIGGIVVGGTASIGVFGSGIFATNANGFTSAAAGAIPTGYLVSMSGKKFATAVEGGTYTEAAGSVGTLGQDQTEYIAGGSLNEGPVGSLGAFANFYVPVTNAQGAKGIVLNKSTPTGAAGGSVAVFKYAAAN